MGKACRVKQRTQTHRKRRVFPGNKKKINDVNNNVNTNNPDVNNVNILSNTPTHDAPTIPTKTVSHSKVQDIVSGTPKSIDSINGYRLIDVHILDSVISAFKCPGCTEQLLTLKERLEKKKGLASSLEIICSRCGYNDKFYTSRTLPYEGKGGKSFDVNARIIYAMRACGQGHAGVEKFTTLMDMPKPMTKNNYNKVVKKLVTATETVAKETMSDAIEELRSASSVSPDSVMDRLISAERPEGLIETYNFVHLSFDMDPTGARRAWPRAGIFETFEVLKTRLVVVPDLPRTPQTLYVRLLGRATDLKTAMFELSHRLEEESTRRLFAALLEFFRELEPIPKEARSKAQEDFVVNAKDIFMQTQLAKEIEHKGREEGEAKGRLEGRLEGQLEGRLEERRTLIAKLLKLKFKEAVTAEVEARIQAATPEQLEVYAERVITQETLEAVLNDD